MVYCYDYDQIYEISFSELEEKTWIEIYDGSGFPVCGDSSNSFDECKRLFLANEELVNYPADICLGEL